MHTLGSGRVFLGILQCICCTTVLFRELTLHLCCQKTLCGVAHFFEPHSVSCITHREALLPPPVCAMPARRWWHMLLLCALPLSTISKLSFGNQSGSATNLDAWVCPAHSRKVSMAFFCSQALYSACFFWRFCVLFTWQPGSGLLFGGLPDDRVHCHPLGSPAFLQPDSGLSFGGLNHGHPLLWGPVGSHKGKPSVFHTQGNPVLPGSFVL